MGNNAAFTSFEATVMATYDKGVLDKDLLSSFMEQHRGSDIDSGGMQGTLSKDGLNIWEVVLRVSGVPIPEEPDDVIDEFYKIADSFGWR